MRSTNLMYLNVFIQIEFLNILTRVYQKVCILSLKTFNPLRYINETLNTSWISHVILYKIDCTRGPQGKLSPREIQCRPRRSRGWQFFRGWQFPRLPSSAVNSYYIILNVKLIHCLHYVWFQTIRFKWMFEFVFRIP